jgi:IS30 family transposase
MSRLWIFRDLTAHERDKICRLYREEKLSMKKIGVRFSLAEATVRRVLREEHIPIRNGNHA